MPTYQYACTECGTPLEVVQSFSDAALTECPTCGGRLRKVYSAVGVVFKGSGFYRTDSRTDSRSDAKSPNGAKPDGDKNAKPAAATVSKDSTPAAPAKPAEATKSSTSGKAAATTS